MDRLFFANLYYYLVIFVTILVPAALFDTIHGHYYTISVNFYNLQYFQQKVFSFSKISGSQTDPKRGRHFKKEFSGLEHCRRENMGIKAR